MRSCDSAALEPLLVPAEGETYAPAMRDILDFALGHRADILDELETLEKIQPMAKWILDLTSTSLQAVLFRLSDATSQLDVVYDEAKPLLAYPDVLDHMIGRPRRSLLTFRKGGPAWGTFDLLRRPQAGSSLQFPGVQIADILAGAARAIAPRDNPAYADLARKLAPGVSAIRPAFTRTVAEWLRLPFDPNEKTAP